MNTTIRHATSTPMMPRERHRTDTAVVHRIGQGHRIKIGGPGRMANSAFGGKLNL